MPLLVRNTHFRLSSICYGMTSSISTTENNACAVLCANDQHSMMRFSNIWPTLVGHSCWNMKVSACQKIHKHGRTQLRKYVLKSFIDEHCARPIYSMESYAIKTGCLFCDQGDRGKGREKDHDLIVSRAFTFDDTLLDKYDKRQIEWANRVQDILSFFSELQSANAVNHRCCTSYGRTSE